MKMIGFVLLASAFFASTAQALSMIPPYFFTAQEITAILASEEVATKLGSHRMIDAVVRDGRNYQVVSQSCRLEVKVEYKQIISDDYSIELPFPRNERILHVGELLCDPI